MPAPSLWQADLPDDHSAPRIALVHGLLAGPHMEKHLLTWLRQTGHADSTLYSNHLPPAVIAGDLMRAARKGRPIVLIGFSQGGFQVVKVARHLARHDVQVDLMISLAAGGVGRLYPPQIGFSVRRIPGNVKRYLNYFATGDVMGTDPVHQFNMARAESAATHLENIAYPRTAGVDHVGIVRCFPEDRVLPSVRQLFLERLQQELLAL